MDTYNKFLFAALLFWLLVLVFLFQGCNFLEVKVDVAQRAILDKGDNTKDGYSLRDTKLEEDKTTSIVKTIP